ncbi:putative aminopeptidase FrvX [Geodermatophilus tzadiensis]|uniref:Putative aminopeptidase FrvX n=1 Tax=Geodermatophilus tzadiensis TaxID=1137988 RepID=A0A2T0T684_9ACTN|nr:peptidase M42 [Geodermatophilus tzadiensis]PRY41164.1 putative aminopeptidase FrvX [Geodermatophilus tzadiensis]
MPTPAPDLLDELLRTYGPCGEEGAVRDVVRRELEPLADEVHVDPAGNLVALVHGTDRSAPAVRVAAHLDELSMIVKRVEPDGTLRVDSLGVMYPGNFGLGPVAVLGRHRTLTGVLTLGSEHTTPESARIWQTKPDAGDQAMDWTHVYVFTGCTADDLAAAGVHPGTRVCVHADKRGLTRFGDFVGSYFLDDRAALTTLVLAARLLREDGGRPPGDVYLVATTSEEMGGIGAAYASRTLPGDLTVALDVGPAEAEYQVTVDGGPVVAYADDAVVYDRALADALVDLGGELGLDPQTAVWRSFDSDASQAMASGQAARAALLSLPTLSTHGYEVLHTGTVNRTARLLAAFLARPVPPVSG